MEKNRKCKRKMGEFKYEKSLSDATARTLTYDGQTIDPKTCVFLNSHLYNICCMLSTKEKGNVAHYTSNSSRRAAILHVPF